MVLFHDYNKKSLKIILRKQQYKLQLNKKKLYCEAQ